MRRRDKGAALAGLIVLAAVTAAAILAPMLSPADPLKNDLLERLTPPMWNAGGSAAHPLGTDTLGRDVLSRLLYGARLSLVVGFVTVIISGAAGVALLSVLGPGFGNLILVLVVSGWITYARIVRGETLSLKHREFVEAARALGALDGRLIWRHLLPNVWAPIAVVATFSVARTIIAEASLSFLGLGVPAPTPSWGAMLDEGRNYITTGWWLALFPGAAILVVVLVINLIGDWLRDALDPRVERGI